MSFAKVVRDLATAMKAKGCPHPVVLGPERSKAAGYGTTRVVLERPKGDASDSSGPARSTHGNPKLLGIRDVGVKLTVYARSPVTGARGQDHQDLAERLADLVIGELDTVVRNIPSLPMTLGASGFVVPEDLEGSEVDGGAAYQQMLTIPHGIARVMRTWADLMSEHAAGVLRPGGLSEVEIVEPGDPGLHFTANETTPEVST